MPALKTIVGYIIMEERPDQPTWWRLLCHNEEIACGPSLRVILDVAAKTFGLGTVMAVWDALRGEYISELIADPNY